MLEAAQATARQAQAQEIAKALGLKLLTVRTSTLTQAGGSVKLEQLKRLLGKAEHSKQLLFFDEADALFGKRSEVKDSHDRYANVEVSHLLSRFAHVVIFGSSARNLTAKPRQARPVDVVLKRPRRAAGKGATEPLPWKTLCGESPERSGSR